MSKQNKKNSDFHINNGDLIELLKLHNSNRIDYNVRKVILIIYLVSQI